MRRRRTASDLTATFLINFSFSEMGPVSSSFQFLLCFLWVTCRCGLNLHCEHLYLFTVNTIRLAAHLDTSDICAHTEHIESLLRPVRVSGHRRVKRRVNSQRKVIMRMSSNCRCCQETWTTHLRFHNECSGQIDGERHISWMCKGQKSKTSGSPRINIILSLV